MFELLVLFSHLCIIASACAASFALGGVSVMAMDAFFGWVLEL